jgi:hypothetical protein
VGGGAEPDPGGSGGDRDLAGRVCGVVRGGRGYTWWRRGESRLGPLVAGVGFVYSVASLNASRASLAYTIGMVVWAIVIVYLAYVFLCFPLGRLGSGLERAFVAAYAASSALVWALVLGLSSTLPPGGPFTDCGSRCPHNALQIVDAPAATGVALNVAFSVVSAISLIVLAMLIFAKALSSASLRRRSMTPLAVVFIANIVEFVDRRRCPADDRRRAR